MRHWGERLRGEQRARPFVGNGQVADLFAAAQKKTLFGIYLPSVVSDAGILVGLGRKAGGGHFPAARAQPSLVLAGTAQAQGRKLFRDPQQNVRYAPTRVQVLEQADQAIGRLLATAVLSPAVRIRRGKARFSLQKVPFVPVLYRPHADLKRLGDLCARLLGLPERNDPKPNIQCFGLSHKITD